MALSPIKNPRKAFNFLVKIRNVGWLPPFGAQEVTLPDSELDSVEHGFGNTVLKTAGQAKPGTLKINRIISLDPIANGLGESEGFYTWQRMAQNPTAQSSGDPDDYKFTIEVSEVASHGPIGAIGGAEGEPIIVSTFVYTGAWPRLINGREYKRTESANVIENIEFEVDYIDPGHPLDS